MFKDKLERKYIDNANNVHYCEGNIILIDSNPVDTN